MPSFLQYLLADAIKVTTALTTKVLCVETWHLKIRQSAFQCTCMRVDFSIATPASKAKCIYLHDQSNSATPPLDCSFLLTPFYLHK